jgi:hypothetical protein
MNLFAMYIQIILNVINQIIWTESPIRISIVIDYECKYVSFTGWHCASAEVGQDGWLVLQACWQCCNMKTLYSQYLMQRISSNGPILAYCICLQLPLSDHVTVSFVMSWIRMQRRISSDMTGLYFDVFVCLARLLCRNNVMYVVLHHTLTIRRCSTHPAIFCSCLCCALVVLWIMRLCTVQLLGAPPQL